MKASPLSELYINECEFFFKNKTGTKYKIEPIWIDNFSIFWDLLKMNGIVGATLSFQDYLSFHESAPLEPGVTLEVNLVDANKSKFRYVFVITDLQVEAVRKKRKRVSLALMDPFSYKMININDSRGFSLQRTNEIWNSLKTSEIYKLNKPVNDHHEFINETKDYSPATDFCKTYSFVLNGKKSLFRNLKEKFYNEGLLCYSDRNYRHLTFLKEIFKDKEPRENIYRVVAENDNYFYKIDEAYKMQPVTLDLKDPSLKKDWYSPFYSQPQKVNIDLAKYELNFEYKKKINIPYNYHINIGENETRLNDISPEGRIIHSYLTKALQRNKIQIFIYGDFTLNVGELIETQLYSSGRADEIDEEMSGVWLVTEIQDVIEPPGFYQIVTLSRPRIMKKNHPIQKSK